MSLPLVRRAPIRERLKVLQSPRDNHRMARLRRLSVPGVLHLVVQGGRKGGLTAVADDIDASAYKDALRDASRECDVAIHAYSIAHDEIRLLCTPAVDGALGGMMQALGRRYVRHFNRRHHRQGSPWGGRFRSTVVHGDDAFAAILCVTERADVLAGGRGGVAGVLCSSFEHHHDGRRDVLIKEHPCYWRLGNTPFEREAAYGKVVGGGVDGSFERSLLVAAAGGWALGPSTFVAEVEKLSGRRVHPLLKGRPPRNAPPG